MRKKKVYKVDFAGIILAFSVAAGLGVLLSLVLYYAFIPKPITTYYPQKTKNSLLYSQKSSNTELCEGGFVVLVIDDIGDDLNIVNKFLSLSLPLTFSVLPNATNSREIAYFIANSGYELMIHLPMEPIGTQNPGTESLKVTMDKITIREIVRKWLDKFEFAKGVNNHMGSKFTSHSDLIEVVLEEIKQRGLYFIDSYTYKDSKAYKVALELKIPSLKRDVFLDVEPTRSFIRKQLVAAMNKIKEKGYVVVIGHPFENTYAVLKENIDLFYKEEICFVQPSYLLEKLEFDGSLM